MATQKTIASTGEIASFSSLNVGKDVLSGQDYLVFDGIDDLAYHAIGTHFEKAVFYIHVSRSSSDIYFRSVCDAVLGKSCAIAICVIDADSGSANSLRQILRRLAHRIDASRDGAVLPIIRVAASVDVASKAPERHSVIKETEGLLKSSGYLPFRIDGYVLLEARELLQAKIKAALELIATFQKNARRPGSVFAVPRWPAILLN